MRWQLKLGHWQESGCQQNWRPLNCRKSKERVACQWWHQSQVRGVRSLLTSFLAIMDVIACCRCSSDTRHNTDLALLPPPASARTLTGEMKPDAQFLERREDCEGSSCEGWNAERRKLQSYFAERGSLPADQELTLSLPVACYRYDLQINHWSFSLEVKLLKCYRYDLQINHCGTDHFHWSETVCWTACRGSQRDSSGHGCNDCVKGSWRPAPSPSMWPSSWMATAALQSSKALIVLKVISRALTNWQRYTWSCIAVWF